MTLDLSAHSLGTTGEFGIPGIQGTEIPVLAFEKPTDTQAVTLLPESDVAIDEWVLGLDVYIPEHSGTYTALLQTGDGDADLFLKKSGDNAGIGTMGDYAGKVPFDEWIRVVLSVSVEDSDTVMRKFVNGTLVGTQNLGATDRWAIDPENGLRLFTDNNGETGAGYVSSIFFTSEPPEASELEGLVSTRPVPTTDGFFAQSPAGGSVEINFDDETVNVSYGDAAVILEGSDYRTPVTVGDSKIGYASQFDIAEPGEDIPVLNYAAFESSEGLHVNLPENNGDLTSFTLVWDIMITATNGYQSLLQIDPANTNDGDFFINSNGGIGINSNYTGHVPTGDWARIVLTVEDLGNGSSKLSKYIDGEFVGTQTMPTSRYTLDADKGLLLMADENGEVGSGYLSHFGIAGSALTEAEIVALGTVDGDGPFADADGLGQLGFDGYTPTPEFGLGSAELIEDVPLPPETELAQIKDMLVTPGTDTITYDLEAVFGDGAHSFSVTNTNGDAVSAAIENGMLSLSFDEYGLSDLVVTAIGPNGEELNDNIRIRVAGEGAYTIAILPDTQDYTSNGSIAQSFLDMTGWLADNAANKGIGFVTHVGDITQWATDSQFTFAREAMDVLRDAGIPFSVLPGNHDIGAGGSSNVRDTDNYNEAFSTSYMSEDATYGGVYDQEPDRYDNNYHLWDAPDGTGWIFLNLEFGPRDDVLRWADEILTEFGDRKAMITTHSYNSFAGRHDPLGGPLEAEGAGYNYGLGNDAEGSWDGEEIWRDVIASHPNVVFTAGGHIFGDGAETVVSYNDYGNAVYQFLVNYQNGVANEANQGGGGGNGAIRLVTVDPENDAVYTETYFTDEEDYFEGYRGSEEESRDGLTGDYKGHQEEFENANIGEREALAEADAGHDQLIGAQQGATSATVMLSAYGTTNPKDDIVSWVWTDRDGNVVAQGAETQTELGAGIHDLTLTVTTSEGVISSDDTRVIVKTDAVHLVETFNDGNADGWMIAQTVTAPKLSFGNDEDFGLPPLGSSGTPVLKVDKLSPTDGIHVETGLDGPVEAYTLIYDLYVPGGQGTWTALFQTDITNVTDGELYIRNSGSAGGIGISGQYHGGIDYDAWNRLAVTISIEDGQQYLTKFVNGVQVGRQVVDSNPSDGSRWTIDGEKGFLLFSDENNEVSDVYVSSFAFTPEAMSADEIAALGSADAEGPLSVGQVDGAFQLNFDGALDAADFGTPEVAEVDLSSSSGTGSFFVKGSATIEDSTVEMPEGALFDQSNGSNKLLVWRGGDWDDVVMEVTIRSMDDDTIGVAFNHGKNGHYLLTLNNQENTRQLIRVDADGSTVLASEAGGYTFNIEQDLIVSKVGGRITVTLDGVQLFGGAVFDATPLNGGTVGLYSSGQKSSIFDDVVVRAPELTAEAGQDRLIIDWDRDGQQAVVLNGEASILPDGSADAHWTGRGVDVDGMIAETVLGAGRNDVTLTLDGSAADEITLNVATGDRLIAADRFDDGNHDGWRIVDSTELGGSADWRVIDGALVETSGAYSRELTWNGANNGDVWDRGWSPLGDGVNALKKGSFALWNGDADLTDYAIQTLVTAPEGAVGMMLNYVDENNYYKVELDTRHGLATLVKVVDNYESTIARSATTYTPGESFVLEARIEDGVITATMDGMQLFSLATEDRDIASGSAGVWSWGAAGARFDDIAIVDLSEDFAYEIHGTDNNDRLTGTDADEVFYLGAGRMDMATGGLGADTFVFGQETSNGMRETTRIADFDASIDSLDLCGAEITRVQETGASTMLWIGEDQDQLILAGVTDFDELAFI
ncbi:LamG-like jellyroll fold domain-containing protein [Qingshengfaniella alkalisoli]|nr:LamG-like jellyroll fold domain-containing protein [Qingshengfaniella alkalisoli]